MTFTWIDWVIVGITFISSLISFFRGFFKEMLSWLTWVVAGVMAWTFSNSLSLMLVAYIETPSLRVIAAATSLFVLTLITGGFISHLIVKLVAISGLTGTDRSLGMVFGGLRGLLLVVVLVGVAGYFPVHQDPWWRESVLLVHFEGVAEWLKSMAVSWAEWLFNKP